MFSEHLMPSRGVKPWLELLMQIAGCILNVQPANLHNYFFLTVLQTFMNCVSQIQIIISEKRQ